MSALVPVPAQTTHLRAVPPRRDPRLDLRVGDAERQACASHLAAAFAAGQLTPAEYEERIAVAAAATRGRDLAELTADLPAPEAPAPARGARAARAGAWVAFDVAVAMLGLAAFVCLMFWQLAVISLPHGNGVVAGINAIGAATVVGAVVHLGHRYLARR